MSKLDEMIRELCPDGVEYVKLGTLCSLITKQTGFDYTNHIKARLLMEPAENAVATVYKGNIIKNLIMDCQSYTKYRPNETTGGIFVSWRRKEELPTGA